MTQARKLIQHAPLGPDANRLMGQVLDAAWRQIGPAFASWSPNAVSAVRVLLARTILQRVREGLTHPDALKEEAIQAVRGKYPTGPLRR